MNIDPLVHLTNWNPLRGLTLAGLMVRIDEGERGDYARLQWTYRAVERRNPTVRAVKRKLRGAIQSLDWTIKARDDVTEEQKAEAEKQAAALRKAYERVGNLRAALVHLALADFRGYAHCNKVYAGEGDEDPWAVVELRPVPQWHMTRRGYETAWTYDPAAKFGMAIGTEIIERDWIAHEVEDPASEIFAACHVQQANTDADWDGFLETYGIPAIFIEGPPNVAKDRESEYQATAEAIVADGRGYLPNGSKVHSVEAPNGGSDVFEQRLGWLQKLIVLAGTGGILSMLAEPTGIGKGASDSHDDTWLSIAAGVAAGVSEALQTQFDLPVLQRNFGDDVEPLAYFELSKPEKSDPTVHATNAKSFSDAGYAIDVAELSEKSGYTLTLKGAPAPAAPNAVATPGAVAAPLRRGDEPNTQDPNGAAADPLQQAGSQPTAPQAADPTQPPADGVAKPPEQAAAPVAPGVSDSAASIETAKPDTVAAEDEKIPEAKDERTSRSGDAKPSIVQAALADSLDVESRWLDPVAQQLDAIETMLTEGRPADEVAAKIEAVIASLPELLGQLDVSALADHLEKATGPAAIQGLRDALATQPVSRGGARPATTR